MTFGTHGLTFVGKPLALAFGIAVLDVLESDGFMANLDRMAKITQDKLVAVVRKHPAVF